MQSICVAGRGIQFLFLYSISRNTVAVLKQKQTKKTKLKHFVLFAFLLLNPLFPFLLPLVSAIVFVELR